MSEAIQKSRVLIKRNDHSMENLRTNLAWFIETWRIFCRASKEHLGGESLDRYA
jgi:hypothetical protein